jgi:hypothetical protein
MSKAQAGALLSSFVVSLVAALLLLATEPRMAIVWDEPYILGDAGRVRQWLRAMDDPVLFAADWRPPAALDELRLADPVPAPPREKLRSRWDLLFDRRVVGWFWPFAREQPHGYPPFSALLALAGDVLAPSWQELPRARLGTMILFSLTAGAVFQFARPRWGNWAAAVAAGAWVLQPNLFGHGHYACFDGALASLWVLSILAFVTANEARVAAQPGAIGACWTLIFGLTVGCAAATKLTGWFLPLPFLAWAALYRDRRALLTLGMGLVIASFVIWVVTPPWWSDPAGGVARFLQSNLTRGKTFPIYVQFLHRVYLTPRESLPWYNTLVWTGMVTPVGFLVFSLVGFASALRRWRIDTAGTLIVGHWAFLMVLRALPQAPGHDGVRQFLPAFGVLALLAGIGARNLLDRWSSWTKVAVGGALAEGVLSLAVMMPVPLSYYSPLVGGLPGAAALGMEPTYYWDALIPEARSWLFARTPPGRTIAFAWYTHAWLYLRRIGELPPRIAPIDRGDPMWYVLQNRPGAFSDAQRSLVAGSLPAYTVTKLGVPLLWIFPYGEFARWSRKRPGTGPAGSDRDRDTGKIFADSE